MNLLLHPDRNVCERFLDFLGGPASIARVIGPRRFSLIAVNVPGRAFYGLSPIDREIRLELEDMTPYLARGLGSADTYLERLRENYQRVVDTGQLQLTETEFVDGDGNVRWSQNKLAPVFEGGRVARILVTYTDVTDLIEARDSLESSLAGIMNASDVSVCSGCGKVAEAHGDWQTLSAFLQDRTELEYSHCLCTPCEQKYFGGLGESTGS